MSLEQFVEATERRDLSMVVVNREAPRPVQGMLEDLFNTQPVTVREEALPDDEDTDIIYLVDDGEVLASSSLPAVQESILFVNSDLYVTGARDPADLELPAVLKELQDVRFHLRGYPESNSEKLLLITISRYIERLALESEGGTHRASFQRLSRINDEQGTRWVYERLADSPVDTHVYGIPDWTPPPEFAVTMHGGWSDEFRTAWFVTFVPAADADSYGALVAIETSPRVWKGFWTYETDEVRRITRYIQREL